MRIAVLNVRSASCGMLVSNYWVERSNWSSAPVGDNGSLSVITWLSVCKILHDWRVEACRLSTLRLVVEYLVTITTYIFAMTLERIAA